MIEQKRARSAKEEAFLTKWTAIREMGKSRYIATRTISYALLLFCIWIGITLMNHPSEQSGIDLLLKALMWFGGDLLIGMTWAMVMWDRKEEKFRVLT